MCLRNRRCSIAKIDESIRSGRANEPIQPDRQPQRPIKKRHGWDIHRDVTAASAAVLETLRLRPDGVRQNELGKRHDPLIVERLIDTLVSRGDARVVFDKKEVGAASRIIVLTKR